MGRVGALAPGGVRANRPFAPRDWSLMTPAWAPSKSPWLALLHDGALEAADPETEPVNYVVQAEWRALLEEAVQRGQGAHWAAWLHLGLMRYQAGAREAARQAWERSLGAFARRRGPNGTWPSSPRKKTDWMTPYELYAEACRMLPDYPLAVECGKALLAADQPQRWLDLVDELPAAVRAAGRVRLLEGQAALAVQDFARVERLFADAPAIEDLREGELSLSQLWFEYHEQRLSALENIPVDESVARARAPRASRPTRDRLSDARRVGT